MMTSAEAFEALNEYLQQEQIEHYPLIDIEDETEPQKILIVFTTDPITIEGELFFYNGSLETRCFYGEEVSNCLREMSDIKKMQLLELVNFINAYVFPPYIPFTPRFYMTADGYYDLTMTTIIPYSMLDEDSEDEIGEYITRYCPKLLDQLAIPLFSVYAVGECAENAIDYIKHYILKEEQ